MNTSLSIFSVTKVTEQRKVVIVAALAFIFIKKLNNKISVIEENKKKGLIWIKIHKEILTTDKDVFICLCYIPPASSKMLIGHDFNFFEEIEKGIEHYGPLGATCIVCDFNARTGNLSDIISSDIYLNVTGDHVQDNDNIDNLNVRLNSDHVTDNYGHKLISLCKSTGHIIANGRFKNDKTGQYTFLSTRGLSVTDYLLINLEHTHIINDFKVLNWNNFSDHAALYLSLKLKNHILDNVQDNNANNVTETKLIFNQDLIHVYRESLNANLHKLRGLSSMSTVNQVNLLTDFMHEQATRVFSKSFKGGNLNSHNRKTQQKPPWFNKECHESKREFKNARNVFNRCKSDENRIHFSQRRTVYNKIRKSAKTHYEINQGKNLENIAKSQP